MRKRLLAGIVLQVCLAAPAAAQGAGAEACLSLVNQERAKVGLAPLASDARLVAAAQGYAELLNQGIPFSHRGPDGSTPLSRMNAAGVNWSNATAMGENIARGFLSAESVMAAWMNSPGHRAAILEPRFTHVGIGVAGTSWVQDFAGLTGAPPSGPGAGAQGAPPPGAIPPPVRIDALTPPVAAPGQLVWVDGAGFGFAPGAVGIHPGVLAPVLVWTPTRILAIVPFGAQSGPLLVVRPDRAWAFLSIGVVPPTAHAPPAPASGGASTPGVRRP